MTELRAGVNIILCLLCILCPFYTFGSHLRLAEKSIKSLLSYAIRDETEVPASLVLKKSKLM